MGLAARLPVDPGGWYSLRPNRLPRWGRTQTHMNRYRLASLLSQAPWIIDALMPFYRQTRARFTAGVVGVVLNAHGEMLLVKHVLHPAKPWGLPGGWLEANEAPAEGIRREILEETGLAITVGAPLLVTTTEMRHHLDIAFLCRADGTVEHLSPELLDHRWAALDEDLPDMPTFHQAAISAHRCNRQQSPVCDPVSVTRND